MAICPQGTDRDAASYEVLDDVEIHRFPLSRPRTGVAGHLTEYANAAWHIARLCRRLGRSRRIDIVHACNPPDFLLALALPLRRRGAGFIFDHHDLSPEMFQAIYGQRAPLIRWACLAVERLAYALADIVLATNESYRQVAMRRGGKRTADVVVVRNAPDVDVFRAEPAARGDARDGYLLAYVGVMGHQDGVEDGVRALAALASRRRDWRADFVGDGPAASRARELATELGIGDLVEFTGWQSRDEVVRILSAADVCLSPEPASPYSDASTLIKVGEYMAMAKPVVCYDLTESTYTAGAAAIAVTAGDTNAFADAVSTLLDDAPRRAAMGAAGRDRITGELSRARSEVALLDAYDRARQAAGRRLRPRVRRRGHLPAGGAGAEDTTTTRPG